MNVRIQALDGFSDDAKKAADASPGYFMAWYTVKSLGLVAAVSAVAWLIGREAGRKDGSRR